MLCRYGLLISICQIVSSQWDHIEDPLFEERHLLQESSLNRRTNQKLNELGQSPYGIAIGGVAYCGAVPFNPVSLMCCNNVVVGRIGSLPRCCGSAPFDSASYMCCGTTVAYRNSPGATCCGPIALNPLKYLCCAGIPVFRAALTTRCCGTIGYDPTTKRCCQAGVLC